MVPFTAMANRTKVQITLPKKIVLDAKLLAVKRGISLSRLTELALGELLPKDELYK